MKRRPPIGFCLAVSHADIESAKLWMRWAVFMSQQPGGDVSKLRLLVTLTKRVAAHDEAIMRQVAASKERGFFSVTFRRLSDEDERGYPGSSSHLFARSLQAFNELYTGYAMMFCEADTVPMRPTWAHELVAEYERKTAPFVGLHIASTREAVDRWGFPAWHVTGNAMYPPNALKLAPSILQCLEADNVNCPWGEKGWAWDLFCAHEIVPESEQTDKIQQIWRSDPWTPNNLHRLNPGAALFHQSKDGSLIATLTATKWGEFEEYLPAPQRCYMLDNGARSVRVGDREIAFRPAVRGVGGRIISIFRPTFPVDDLLLVAAAGRAGLSVISDSDYESLLSQAKRNRIDL